MAFPGRVAIKNEPKGFIPWGRILSTHEYNGGTAAAIHPGDAVSMRADGVIIVATAGSTQLIGVAVSRKSATYTTVLVYDDPDQQYLVQDDGSGVTVLVSTHLGLNADLVATAANTTHMKSKHQLDRDTIASTAAQLRLLGIVSVTGANSLCRVVINEHAWAKKFLGVV